MNFKKIIGACQAVLLVGIILLFFTTCININPIKQVALPAHKYNGFKAFLGATSDFSPSVGGVMTVVFVGIAIALAILKIFLPKISIIWNSLIAIFAVLIAIFLFCGATDFMVNASNNAITSYKYYCDVQLSVGTILGGIIAILVAAASVCDEVLAFRNK